jgi:2-succinyl-6-hydroxy-2,4-cyclohexadiene-1-carboxylate synthase
MRIGAPPPVACRRVGGSEDRERGFGNSTVHAGEVGPQSARRDLLALFGHLELDSAIVVGQSLGGYVALGFAIEHSDLVDSLVLSTTLARAAYEHVDKLINAEPDRNRSNRREHPVLSREFCTAHPDLGELYNQISSFGARPSPSRSSTRWQRMSCPPKQSEESRREHW